MPLPANKEMELPKRGAMLQGTSSLTEGAALRSSFPSRSSASGQIAHMAVPMLDYADLAPADKTSLEQVLRDLTTLERVLNWARRQTPPIVVDEILTQDEYTHDVLLLGPKGLVLNFDTT